MVSRPIVSTGTAHHDLDGIDSTHDDNYIEIVPKRGSHSIRLLPDYGEVKIVTHGGKITFIETTTKEKVE